MSDSVRPHGRQPTRLPSPWDAPGKNTGVGCDFLLQCLKVKNESEVAQLCPTLSDPMDCSLPKLLHPWDFPGKSTGVGCHFLLQCMKVNFPGKSIGAGCHCLLRTQDVWADRTVPGHNKFSINMSYYFGCLAPPN